MDYSPQTQGYSLISTDQSFGSNLVISSFYVAPSENSWNVLYSYIYYLFLIKINTVRLISGQDLTYRVLLSIYSTLNSDPNGLLLGEFDKVYQRL